MTARQKGVAAIVTSAFGFALMAFFVRLCDDFGPAVSSFQKSLFRNLVALLFAAAIFVRERRAGDSIAAALPKRAWGMLLARSVFGCAGIFGNFYALGKIPIGEAMTLNKTAPCFAVLFSWIFLHERATPRRLLSLATAFAGAVLVMKPGFRESGSWATLAALGGGIGAGAAYACVRELGVLGVRGSFIVLFFSAFSTAASLPFTIAAPAAMTSAQWLILLGAGAGACLGQFGVTAAYRLAPPAEIAVYDYTNVIFTAALGCCFFGQIPDLASVAGFLLIVLAGLRK